MRSKKIIAREGLVFLGFLFLSIAVGMFFRDTRYHDGSLRLITGYPYKVFSLKNMLITFSGYTVYLSIRFIIWAVKTLKKELLDITPKLKKLVAGEGLVIIGIILLGLFVIGTNYLCNAIFVKNYINTPEQNKVGLQIIAYAHYDAINAFGFLIICFGYPIYLIIRFITWAVRTIKEK
ncbi:MAG: hypothetical protein A3I73_00875 [Omnitrophica bacterium RIFCSPLOWO2_02_FULL_45_16]|nr:MAG: hypothetical protein A3C51_04305 [Omnitrophica bacterium RIFCSPHIGHO2_02_FULL_46_20]OGX00758.1 MAG: hypothetical protein A3I73_00875 [Omnitrophica bacterium RIFCSPLOWO2_02_FULL_45_16]